MWGTKSKGTSKGKEKDMEIHSLTKRYTVIVAGLVAGTVCLIFILNTLFLESFYRWNRQRIIESGFVKINKAAEEEALDSEEFGVEFERLCANSNLMIMIIRPDGKIVRSSVNDNQTMLSRFMEALFLTDESTANIKDQENYEIYKRRDERMDSEYLILVGTLADGNLIMMRTALESIRESSLLTNEFLVAIGLVAIMIGILITGIVTRRITNPILQLTELSEKMTELDFEAKYRPAGKYLNEIDLLGEHMNQLSEKLEHTIQELKNANNELMADNEKKTQIDEMRKEFLSNVSHELKTPLALIQGYAEGLQECINDDAESREFYCEVIMDETDKMNRMVKKLLTLNHLEFGNDPVTLERFNLTELILNVLNASSILLEQNQITVQFAESALYVWADEFMTEEVVTNYLSNAIHYALYEKRIAVYYTKKETCVRVSVFNTGDPIPEEDLEKVWIKFYKVDKARTREYGGSGIGLSIVKAIMDALHQQCGVINHPDGVEFWMELNTK